MEMAIEIKHHKQYALLPLEYQYQTLNTTTSFKLQLLLNFRLRIQDLLRDSASEADQKLPRNRLQHEPLTPNTPAQRADRGRLNLAAENIHTTRG